MVDLLPAVVISSISGLLASFISIRIFVIDILFSKKIRGRDVHKADKRELPDMGGIALLIGIAASVVSLSIMGFLSKELLSLFLSVLISGIIGIIDGFLKLGSHVKTALTMVIGVPIILLQTYSGTLRLPFGVDFRIPILYNLLVLIALSVTSNCINMFDPVNGAASGTSLIALVALYSCSLIGSALGIFEVDIILATISFAIIFPSAFVLFIYNKYPSRVFIGDVGTLSLGSCIGAYVIINGLEVAGVIVLMLQITNSFFILFSVGRLFERREIKNRPIIVTPDERIEPSLEPKAPITLTRLMAMIGYSREKDIVNAYYLMAVFCAVLSIISIQFMR